MISMKLTPAEAKEEAGYAEPKAPEYPWGLSISLDSDTLAKLGITSLPEVGGVMYLQARCEVCSTSQYSNQDGKDQCMSLQITDMTLSTGQRSDESIGKALFDAPAAQ
jgi:hypothetical protein